MPIFPSLLPAKALPRLDFDMEVFRGLHKNRGKKVWWEMAAICPCGVALTLVSQGQDYAQALGASEITREARPDCAVCNGRGWYSHSRQEIQVLLHDMSSNPKRFGVSGDYAQGKSVISFLPENKPNEGDRITLQFSVQRVHDWVRRNQQVTQALRFPVVTQTLNTANGPVQARVLQAIRADANNIVQANQVMTEGIDFGIDTAGRITWFNGPQTPAMNAWFSITYFANQRYKVIDTPYAARDTSRAHKLPAPTDIQMPIRALAQQEWRGDGTNQGTVF